MGDISSIATTQKLPLLGAAAVTQASIIHQDSLFPPALINQPHVIHVIPTSWAMKFLPASGVSDTSRAKGLLLSDKTKQMHPFNGAN